VNAGGLRTDVEPLGDLRVGATCGHEFEDLALAWGESELLGRCRRWSLEPEVDVGARASATMSLRSGTARSSSAEAYASRSSWSADTREPRSRCACAWRKRA
jgi:hypothetical protein